MAHTAHVDVPPAAMAATRMRGGSNSAMRRGRSSSLAPLWPRRPYEPLPHVNTCGNARAGEYGGHHDGAMPMGMCKRV